MTNKSFRKYLSAAITLIVIVVFFVYYDPFDQKNTCPESGCSSISSQFYPQTIGQCSQCMPLKDSGIPYDNGIGEYLDMSVYRKLQLLAKINRNWRVTEAYPPTVKHLSFCHDVGTCADIALYHNKINEQDLTLLCRDAIASGLTVLNEYSSIKISGSDQYCPQPDTFETTTGANLHVY